MLLGEVGGAPAGAEESGGAMSVMTLGGTKHTLSRGVTASIPAGTEHAYRGDGHYPTALTMSAPGGLEILIAFAGEFTSEHVFGAAVAVDLGALRSASSGLDVSFA